MTQSINDSKIKEEQVRLREMDEDIERVAEKIVNYLRINKASYVSELSFNIQENEYDIKKSIVMLLMQQKIETITVSFDYPDPRLLYRVPDQSQIGQAGFENFSRKRWIGLKQ